MTPTEANYTTTLKFKAFPFSVSVNTTSTEVLETLKTGLFKNQAVEWVNVANVQSDDEEQTHAFIYNIEAAKSGAQPWSLTCQ